MKPNEMQTYRRRSGTGLMIMCAGVLAVLLSERMLFLVGGAVLEVIGLLMFIGGMWQQKKGRDAAQTDSAAPQTAPQSAAAADALPGADEDADGGEISGENGAAQAEAEHP